MILPNRILTIQKIFAFILTVALSGTIACKDDDQQPAPQAASISPNSGFPGSLTVIRGSNFSSERADIVVTFNGKVASIVQATPQQLDVVVPHDADTGPVAIVVNVKGTVASSQLVYAVVPFSSTVTSINPSKGGYNTDVSITGSNFHPVAADNKVTFNGIPVIVKTATETNLTVTISQNIGTGAVVVNGSTAGPTFTYVPDIFVVGFESIGGHTVGKCWKNGVVVFTSDPLKSVSFNAVKVVGNDIHVIGSEIKPAGNFVATYWKNGTASPLHDITKGSGATALDVIGNDVYVAGQIVTSAPTLAAAYWKNGVPTMLTDGKYNAIVRDITVVGSDVYITGDSATPTGYFSALYWKNGNAVTLTDGINRNGSPSAIQVVGNDVYVAGSENNSSFKYVAKYWKNGQANPLTNGIQSANAVALKVVGNDVYVAGYETNSAGRSVVKYWKNSNETTLTDGSRNATATGIAVIGDDIYVSGFESNGSVNVAKYWKNGTPIFLTDGANSSTASGIFIR